MLVDMQDIGLLLVHSRGSQKPAVNSMKIVGVGTRQLLELIMMFLLDALARFVVRVAICVQNERGVSKR
jgi:hypothetical protein